MEESEEESYEQINNKPFTPRKKQRYSSLDKISEKSKEVSDNIKDFSTLSNDSKKKEKLRPNSEKVKKNQEYSIENNIKTKKGDKNGKKAKDKEIGEFKNTKIIKEKVSEEDEDENIKDKNKINKRMKTDGEKDKKNIKKEKEEESYEEEEKKDKKSKLKKLSILERKKEVLKKDKNIDEENISDIEEEFEEEEDNVEKNKIKYKRKTKKEKENIKKEEDIEENVKKSKKIKEEKNEKDKEQIDDNLKTLDSNIKKNVEFINFQKKYILKSILKIKKAQNDNLFRYYLNIWKNNKKNISSPTTKQSDNSISKKYAAKIIYILINNLNKKFLNKKFNQWRRITNNISNGDNSLKKTKNVFTFSDIIRSIISRKYYHIFINKLKKHFNPNNKVLNKIIINLIKKKKNKQNQILSKYLTKWYNKSKIMNTDKDFNKNIEQKITLKFIIKKIDSIYKNKKLKNALNKWWKQNSNYSIEKIIKIQTFFRQIVSRNKYENLKLLNDILLNIFNNREKNERALQIFNLRKWNMITTKLSCINKIVLIQNYFRNYLEKKETNKYKTFFYNIFKSKLINTLNELAKYYSLKLSISYVAKNRVILKIYEKIQKNKIFHLLNKIIKNIDGKNGNKKLNYYISKWSNRVNYIKNKDNKKLKVLLLRIFDRKDNLKNLLKSYFLRWKRIHNLLSIIDSVIKIQNNWRKKKSLDNYNKKKESQNIIINMLTLFDKAYKKNALYSFINKLKSKNKKYLLSKIENDFTNKKNDNLRYIMEKIRAYIKYKYLYQTIKISENAKNQIIKKYFINWKNKTINGNKAYNYLTKFIEKKDMKNKQLLFSILLKWLYLSKLHQMEQKVIFIQKIFRTFKNINDSLKNWEKLKNEINLIKRGKEIKEIIKSLKLYRLLDLIKNNIRKSVLKEFNHNNKLSLFIKKMKKILIEITENKSSKLLKKYFIIWKDNINKDIEREEKLSDLLYVIEKRMNINSAKYLSYVSLLKIVSDGILELRKYECFKKLRDFYQAKRNMSNLSNSLSLAYNDIRNKKQKILMSKILKYWVYQKFLKLFEKIKQQKLKELKVYKTKFITNLKKKINSLQSSLSSQSEISKKKRYSQPGKLIFKPKQKPGMKPMNKTKNKSLIKVNSIKTDQKKTKEKEKINGKEKIRKNIVVKGAISKSTSKKEKDKEKEKEEINNNEKLSINNKSIEESESENEYIKENLKYLYVAIEKILTKRIKESLFIFKEKIYSEKTPKEKEEEKIFYTKKLYKTLKNLTIKKIFVEKEEICRANKLIKLIKITSINSQISSDRWLRTLLRRWRFISFVKNVSKKNWN